MRVLIVGIGSRGDVAPYVGLGRRLDEAGCEVAIATHDTFAEMVSEAGLEWRSVSGDPRQVIRARTQGAPSEGRTATRDFVSSMGHDIADAAELGTDVILTCLGQTPLSLLVAESLGVPSMGVYLAPAVPTREFPMPGQPPDDAPDPDHRTAGRQMLARGRTVYADVLPQLTRRLRLPADSVDRVWDRWLGDSGWPISLGYSAAVVPRPDDWSESVDVAGYWWPPASPGWRPAPALVDFLAAGPPPVLIGFGSMGVGVGEQLAAVVTEAVRTAGVRAVVQAGWAGLSVPGDAVLQIGDAPHEWLLPRMAAAVHHAGAGTTGASLRAGLPTVAVPFLADQPFWAERIHRIGAGPPPLPFKDLDADRLATAIRAALDEPGYRVRASELARVLESEDGAAAVLARLDRLAD